MQQTGFNYSSFIPNGKIIHVDIDKKELLKINFSYIFIILLNTFLLWFFTETIYLNIYFTQVLIIVTNIAISIKLNFNYVFKNE
jgi:hypothetical protein